MPSSKTNDYAVEKILEKGVGGNGRPLYLVKWKGRISNISTTYLPKISFSGYSSAENTWEPASHLANCQELIKEFEAEEANKKKSHKKKSNASEERTSNRSPRSSLPRSTKSGDKNEKSDRGSNRNSAARQLRKRPANTDGYFTEDESDDDDYVEKKSLKPVVSSSKRTRKNTTDTDITVSSDSHDSDVLDTAKLDRILDVRRDKKSNTIEYHIQLKQIKKPTWSKSDRLTESYSQQVIDFLEEKYV
jgi:hypothetical protein